MELTLLGIMVIMILYYCCNSSWFQGLCFFAWHSFSVGGACGWAPSNAFSGNRRFHSRLELSWAALCLHQAATFYLASEKKSTTSRLQELWHKRSCVCNRCSLLESASALFDAALAPALGDITGTVSQTHRHTNYQKRIPLAHVAVGRRTLTFRRLLFRFFPVVSSNFNFIIVLVFFSIWICSSINCAFCRLPSARPHPLNVKTPVAPPNNQQADESVVSQSDS